MRYIFLLLLAAASFNLSSQNQLMVGSQLEVGDRINVTDVISMISSPISEKGMSPKVKSTFKVFGEIEVKSISEGEINFLMVIDSLGLEEVVKKDTSFYPVNYNKRIPRLNVSIINSEEGRSVMLNNEQDLMKMIYYTAENETRVKYLERINKNYFTELFLSILPYENGTDLKSKEFLETQEKRIKNKEMMGTINSNIEDVRILKKGLVGIEKTSKYSLESFANKETSITIGSLLEVISLDVSTGVINSVAQVNNYEIVSKNSTEKSEGIIVEENRTITCSFK